MTGVFEPFPNMKSADMKSWKFCECTEFVLNQGMLSVNAQIGDGTAEDIKPQVNLGAT